MDKFRDILLEHYEAASQGAVTSSAAAIYWGWAAELQAAAAYLREPVYVIDVLPSGTIAARSHGYADLHKADERVVEVGNERLVTVDNMTAFVQACRWELVLPVILLLRRGATGGHYQALRFAEHFHATRHAADAAAEDDRDMRRRLHDIQTRLGLATTKADEAYVFDSPPVPTAPRRHQR